MSGSPVVVEFIALFVVDGGLGAAVEGGLVTLGLELVLVELGATFGGRLTAVLWVALGVVVAGA